MQIGIETPTYTLPACPITAADLIRHLGDIEGRFDISRSQAGRIAAQVVNDAAGRSLYDLEDAENDFTRMWVQEDWWVSDFQERDL